MKGAVLGMKLLETWFNATVCCSETFKSRVRPWNTVKSKVVATCIYPLWLDNYSVEVRQ